MDFQTGMTNQTSEMLHTVHSFHPTEPFLALP